MVAGPRPENESDPRGSYDQQGAATTAKTTAAPLPLVEVPEERVGQECEQLDERDAGVACVEVGPLGRVDRDPRDELSESADRLLAAIRVRVEQDATLLQPHAGILR